MKKAAKGLKRHDNCRNVQGQVWTVRKRYGKAGKGRKGMKRQEKTLQFNEAYRKRYENIGDI